MLKTLMVRSAILAFTCAMSLAAHAYASNPKHFDVPAGDLTAALQALAKQSGIEFVYQSRQLKGLRTKGIIGTFTTEAAVTKLLEGTPLTFRKDPSGALLIAPPKSSLTTSQGASASDTRANSSPSSGEERGRDSGKVRLTQAEPSNPSPGTGADKSEGSYESQELPAPAETDKAIPEVLVKGSRSINADIRRTEDDIQPYVLFDRAQIEDSMSVNLDQLLKTRLPMNTVQTTFDQVAGATLGNTSSINLRGLGTNQTLVLIDGRRMASVSNSGTFSQPDVNAIPLSSIERIEVLPSTASGIYGGGATGGVINIITRKDKAGIDIGVTYGSTFSGDASHYRVDGSAGFGMGDSTQIQLVASSTRADPISVGARDFVDQARALQMANNANAAFSLGIPPLGYTSNIRSQNGSNLVLDNGTPLNSPSTFVPVGYAGPSSDNGAALAANAGQYNFDLPRDVQGTEQTLFKDPTFDSATLNLRRQLGKSVEAFVDASWFDNHSSAFTGSGVVNSTTLPASAPNNPFTAPIVVSFPASGLAFPLETRMETVRALGGVIVRLGNNWSLAADYVWSRARLSSSSTNPAIGDPDGPGAGTSAAAALADGSLNVMRDLNEFPLDYRPYLLPVPNRINGPFETILRDANLRVSGSVLELPAGTLTAAALLEHRNEEAQSSYIDLTNTSAQTSAFFVPNRSQAVDSYYLEASAPLISMRNRLRGVQALELQASVRHEEYETRAPSPSSATLLTRASSPPGLTYLQSDTDATSYTIGIRYTPLQALKLRTSFGTGFLPPTINQIVPSAPTSTTGTLIDPKRGAVSATVPPFLLTSGGSTALVPEHSESWSAGFIFTPQFASGWRLSVDYTRIEKEDEIRTLSAQQVVNLEDSLPGRVTRLPLTTADASLGYTGGVISALDIRTLNLARTQLEAYDIQSDYTVRTNDLGEFHLYLVATWQPHFFAQVFPTQPAIDSVGHKDGPLEWRGNAGLAWKRGSWTIGWNAQYYGAYHVFAATDSAAVAASTELSQGSDKISSQTYHDIFAHYRRAGVSNSLRDTLGNVEIRLGIQNVLDESPQIIATTASNGGYSTYGDPRMRRYSISVYKMF